MLTSRIRPYVVSALAPTTGFWIIASSGDTDQKKGFIAIDEIDETTAEPKRSAGGFAIHHCLILHKTLRNETDRTLPRPRHAFHGR